MSDGQARWCADGACAVVVIVRVGWGAVVSAPGALWCGGGLRGGRERSWCFAARGGAYCCMTVGSGGRGLLFVGWRACCCALAGGPLEAVSLSLLRWWLPLTIALYLSCIIVLL